MLFADAVFNIFAGVLMFSMMFAKTSLLFCCFCIRFFQTSMLLFVSVCCYAKARCYYSCPYAVMRKLDAIIRVRMLLCETSMLLFVSVCCYAKPRCYYSCPYAVMQNLDAIINRAAMGRARFMFYPGFFFFFRRFVGDQTQTFLGHNSNDATYGDYSCK